MVSILQDGRAKCELCGSVYSNHGTAKMHVIRMHLVPELFRCTLCQAIIRHRLDFAKHINRKHNIRGVRGLIETYAMELSSKRPSPQ
jgi:hypothetical protein